jgi:hypothetical protein
LLYSVNLFAWLGSTGFGSGAIDAAAGGTPSQLVEACGVGASRFRLRVPMSLKRGKIHANDELALLCR